MSSFFAACHFQQIAAQLHCHKCKFFACGIRHTIPRRHSQIDAFRRTALRAGPPVDAITGAAIPADKVRVDHAPPTFETLVCTWQEENFLTDANLATFEPRQGSGEVLLLDRDLAADWRVYHARRAVLRLVSEETNQALQRRAA